MQYFLSNIALIPTVIYPIIDLPLKVCSEVNITLIKNQHCPVCPGSESITGKTLLYHCGFVLLISRPILILTKTRASCNPFLLRAADTKFLNPFALQQIQQQHKLCSYCTSSLKYSKRVILRSNERSRDWPCWS